MPSYQNEVSRTKLSKVLEHKQEKQTDGQTDATERITTAAFASGRNEIQQRRGSATGEEPRNALR